MAGLRRTKHGIGYRDRADPREMVGDFDGLDLASVFFVSVSDLLPWASSQRRQCPQRSSVRPRLAETLPLSSCTAAAGPAVT